ncbi:type I restriction endonuclease [Agromyces sp. PvR057]|uniref:type I restriction endonuclease subunit R n=1 Tax=Agromyces sp. PvR057 TaxID=3156403 RepID=UPI0033918CC2
MTKPHLEAAFESDICDELGERGWLVSQNDDGYDKQRAMYPADVWAWLAETQAEQLVKAVPGIDAQRPIAFDALSTAQRTTFDGVLNRIAKALAVAPINGGGTLGVLKGEVASVQGKFRLFQAKPTIGFNETTAGMYAANRLRVMRQVVYSQTGGRELDLVLFLNGLPVATVELKTDLTQDAAAALRQYAHDRPPVGEPLLEFGRGALVHLVVSNELVYLTTRLDGQNTIFLPFNQGHDHGAGNPPREGTSPTAYLWEETLVPDAWLDLLARFAHYRYDTRTDAATGKQNKVSSLRFPRYHQWRAVTKLESAALADDSPGTYLIQHSAGSGKTDSIAWAAHRFASLHRPDGSKVFDGVIVVSDRRVLDGQLSKAVAGLETTPGVFTAVKDGEGGAKSSKLVDALIARKPIIGVTLQTFPFALEALDNHAALAGRAYAVIADEAHSSQSGEGASAIKKLLALGDASDDGHAITATSEDLPEPAEAEFDSESVLSAHMAAKAGSAGNVTFVAFTATPKAKTLELFGTPDASTGEKLPFDLYAMKQAIEEGFILDVLKNYVTYDTAFKIAHTETANPDKEVDVSKASSELMQWVQLHPHNIAQRVAVIVEHFRRVVAHELGGQAKAMVVTASRKHAVRYHQAMERYLADRGLAEDIGVLVAFSGTVHDGTPPSDRTEASMNPAVHGASLEEAFDTDTFDVMIVANKYQTGFDQPKLVAMYVDKKLSGITAVQTLSRLNRVIPGKVNTYVLDFVNDPKQIESAFQTYYEDARLDAPSDPNVVYDMLMKLKAAKIVDRHDVDAVVEQWLHGKSHNTLYSLIKKSSDVFWDRWNTAAESGDEAEAAILEEFRSTVSAYVRAYDFLSQLLDYGDTEVERWAIFLRVFARKIQRQHTAGPGVADDIVLTHYRMKRLGNAGIALHPGAGTGLTGITDTGSATPKETKYGPLSSVIERINELFAGTGIGETDQVNAISSLLRHAAANPTLQAQAMANTEQDFSVSPDLEGAVEDVAYAAGDGHSKAIAAVLTRMDLGEVVKVLLGAGLYEALRREASEPEE